MPGATVRLSSRWRHVYICLELDPYMIPLWAGNYNVGSWDCMQAPGIFCRVRVDTVWHKLGHSTDEWHEWWSNPEKMINGWKIHGCTYFHIAYFIRPPAFCKFLQVYETHWTPKAPEEMSHFCNLYPNKDDIGINQLHFYWNNLLFRVSDFGFEILYNKNNIWKRTKASKVWST